MNPGKERSLSSVQLRRIRVTVYILFLQQQRITSTVETTRKCCNKCLQIEHRNSFKLNQGGLLFFGENEADHCFCSLNVKDDFSSVNQQRRYLKATPKLPLRALVSWKESTVQNGGVLLKQSSNCSRKNCFEKYIKSIKSSWKNMSSDGKLKHKRSPVDNKKIVHKCVNTMTLPTTSQLQKVEKFERRKSEILNIYHPVNDPFHLAAHKAPTPTLFYLLVIFIQIGIGKIIISIFLVQTKIDNSVVAIKEISFNSEEGIPFTAIREASLLKALVHANIVTLHEIILKKRTLYLMFEFVKNEKKAPICTETFCLLHAANELMIILILIAYYLGLARAKSIPSRSYSCEVVTLWYRPPDVLLGSHKYSTSLDMWGVGCIFAEMITGTVLFAGSKNVQHQLQSIFEILGTPSGKFWKDLNLEFSASFMKKKLLPKSWSKVSTKFSHIPYCENLLSLFLKLEPSERITANDALQHCYFETLPKAIHHIPQSRTILST
ncbi:serine/threonine-protein kinase PCTAIRE-2 [Trichinella spiralis]|uniref:serine/threonine-protein kinase PCTAIRE-2 n=1 Tax=Trichinella spiralis TaxID=6334 RepID=UPI0001EFE53A|nr:serine/threonine-protein kinase PCTAIRE-2 [Trichinella spiralis]